MPPIAFTPHCYQTDKDNRTLSFTGPPIRVLVKNGPHEPTVPFFVHASAVCRWSNLFQTQFEQHQIATHVWSQAKAHGAQVPLPEGQTSWQECTVHIPNCDPEIFELYLNWHYMERFPIPIELSEDETENSDDDGTDFADSVDGTDGTDDDEVVDDVNIEEGDGGGPQTNWRAHAMLFLTRALMLGHYLHDECFQFELMKVIQQVNERIFAQLYRI